MKLLVAAAAAALACAPVGAQQGQTTSPPSLTRREALEQLDALGGIMPKVYRILFADPCFGEWILPTPDLPLRITVLRFAGLPVAHVREVDGGGLQNVLIRQLGAHTISFDALGATYTMQCGAAGARVDQATPIAGTAAPTHVTLHAKVSDPEPEPHL